MCDARFCKVAMPNIYDLRKHLTATHGVRSAEAAKRRFKVKETPNSLYKSPKGALGPKFVSKRKSRTGKDSNAGEGTSEVKRAKEEEVQVVGVDGEKEEEVQVVGVDGEKKEEVRLVGVDGVKNKGVDRLIEIRKAKDQLEREEKELVGKMQVEEVEKWRKRYYELLDSKLKREGELKKKIKELEDRQVPEVEPEFQRMYNNWKSLNSLKEC